MAGDDTTRHCCVADAMLEAVDGELAGCKDVARLVAGADCLTLLLACGPPRQQHALRSLLGLMRGRFPRVSLLPEAHQSILHRALSTLQLDSAARRSSFVTLPQDLTHLLHADG